jgi:hypothetical protein
MFEPSTFNAGSHQRLRTTNARPQRVGATRNSGSLFAWSVLLVGLAALIALIAPGA